MIHMFSARYLLNAAMATRYACNARYDTQMSMMRISFLFFAGNKKIYTFEYLTTQVYVNNKSLSEAINEPGEDAGNHVPQV